MEEAAELLGHVPKADFSVESTHNPNQYPCAFPHWNPHKICAYSVHNFSDTDFAILDVENSALIPCRNKWHLIQGGFHTESELTNRTQIFPFNGANPLSDTIRRKKDLGKIHHVNIPWTYLLDGLIVMLWWSTFRHSIKWGNTPNKVGNTPNIEWLFVDSHHIEHVMSDAAACRQKECWIPARLQCRNFDHQPTCVDSVSRPRNKVIRHP